MKSYRLLTAGILCCGLCLSASCKKSDAPKAPGPLVVAPTPAPAPALAPPPVPAAPAAPKPGATGLAAVDNDPAFVALAKAVLTCKVDEYGNFDSDCAGLKAYDDSNAANDGKMDGRIFQRPRRCAMTRPPKVRSV